MYPETALYQDSGPYYDENGIFPVEEVDRPMSLVQILGLGGWLSLCLIGFALSYWTHEPLVGACIAGGATLLGMLLNPTFSLSMMMLVLPTGAGIGYVGSFSLERGVGLALAISFLFYIGFRRPDMGIKAKALWVAAAYFIYAAITAMWGVYINIELERAFTQVQLLILVLIVYWYLENSPEGTFRWALRAYVLGTLLMVAWAIITGVAFAEARAGDEGRFTSTVGNAIDANHMGVLLSIGFINALYLFLRDKRLFWRIIYFIALVMLPLMIIKTGSRGAVFALAFTLLSPLLFVRQVAKKPMVLIGMIALTIVLAGACMVIMEFHGLEKGVSHRLTDVNYMKESLDLRLSLISAAIDSSLRYPMGTSFTGWFQRSAVKFVPHNDFFYSLGIYGILGAALFAAFIFMMIMSVKRMPMGLEKLYARALLTFLLVMGLDLGQLAMKVYWISMVLIVVSAKFSAMHAANGAPALYENEMNYGEVENPDY